MVELFRSLYQNYFSKPAHYRAVFRRIKKTGLKSIVQLGIGSGDTAKRMIAAAQKVNPDVQVHFTGIDLFEARPADQEKCTLIDAHRMFNETGAKPKLMPGDPMSALSRIANSITKADLMIVSADQDLDSLDRAWFYVPRFLADDAVVLIEERIDDNKFEFEWLNKHDVEKLAKRFHPSSKPKAA